MKHKSWLFPLVLSFGMSWLALNAAHSQESTESSRGNKKTAIAPAKSIQTGLLLEPPLDLDWFTREKFVELSSTVGSDKIGKKWTSPVVTLPLHERSDPQCDAGERLA